MITFLEVDIFDIAVDILVNPVNCVGVMGAGLALQFKKRYPAMFQAYKTACKNPGLKPGQVLEHVDEHHHAWIVNLPTKRHWKDPSSLADVELGLQALSYYLIGPAVDRAREIGRPLPLRVAVPALGCGLGQLSWNEVRPLMELHLGTIDPNTAEIYVLEPQ